MLFERFNNLILIYIKAEAVVCKQGTYLTSRIAEQWCWSSMGPEEAANFADASFFKSILQ